MKIILSPAKKIKVDTDSIESLSEPVFKEKQMRFLDGYRAGLKKNSRKCGSAMTRLLNRI